MLPFSIFSWNSILVYAETLVITLKICSVFHKMSVNQNYSYLINNLIIQLCLPWITDSIWMSLSNFGCTIVMPFSAVPCNANPMLTKASFSITENIFLLSILLVLWLLYIVYTFVLYFKNFLVIIAYRSFMWYCIWAFEYVFKWHYLKWGTNLMRVSWCMFLTIFALIYCTFVLTSTLA